MSPITLIKKSYTDSSLGTSPEYHLVVNFKYLNSHLPDVKFSYPEDKHILHKIGRSSAKIYSVLDLRAAFHSINLSVYASPGSSTYQSNRLSIGLKSSPAIWNSSMGDILSELPDNIRACIECIMDNVIVYTADIKLHKRVLKCFLKKLRDHGLLLTINKVYIFRSKFKWTTYYNTTWF